MVSASRLVGRFKLAAGRIPGLRSVYRRVRARIHKHLASGSTGVVPGPMDELDSSFTPDLEFLQSLGYSFDPPAISRAKPRRAPLPPPAWPDAELFFVTICTVNHVHYTRTLLESIRRHHAEATLVVAVVDAARRDAVAIEGAIVLTGRDVLGDELDYAALKFTASELCCAAKPAAIDYVLEHSRAGKLVYVDSDIHLFAPLETLIAGLDDADFVVTPHTIAPMPFPERDWERPNVHQIVAGGVLNAGLFGLRRGEQSRKFVSDWKWLSTVPGGSAEEFKSMAEQQAFNLVTSFVERVVVLRDTAYNVAYWNLHDRAVRYSCGEDGAERWTVDGKPLVTFHFSGFPVEGTFALSRHENRYSAWVMPALARLRDYYLSRLRANDRGEAAERYAFDRFPSGVRIDELMRAIFRTHELLFRADASAWESPEGEAHFARMLLSPVAYTGSLVPVLIQRIRDIRPDLAVLGDVSLDPTSLVNWMLVGGAREYGNTELFDLHRPVVPTHDGAMLLSWLHRKWPGLFAGLARPMRGDRQEFLARLARVDPHAEGQVRACANELYLVGGVEGVRRFVEKRADLLANFPDLLFADAPAFVKWLRQNRLKQHFLPVEAIDAFESCAGRSLARVYSYVSRSWPMMEAWPLALVGEASDALSRELLRHGRHTAEYGSDDVEMFLWMMARDPSVGLPLTLELPIHATRHPSSRSAEGQDEILAPLREHDPRFADALAAYRLRYPPAPDPMPPSRRTSRDVSVIARIGRSRRVGSTLDLVAPGANVFGYHRSAIGLGQWSRSLVEALRAVRCRTSPVTLTNLAMDRDIVPDDFIRRYDTRHGTNIFVSYPHMPDSLLLTMPDEVVAGHRNVAHLAWEQSEGTHYWKDVYAEFDQVWAISDFCARSLATILEREVHSVPCVVDVASFPPASSRELHSLDPDAYTFLYIYDANSSTERKNPEAAVDAFRRAFRADDDVRLVIKATNGGRIGNRARLRRLLDAARADARIEIRVEEMERARLYGLISVADCYVSLHRCEGFGYTCAESMAYGRPVIATGYSGNMQFMNESNSYPVRYREVEVETEEGPFQRGSVWAEADRTHAAELMRYVYENRDEAAMRGAKGRETIQRELSPASIGARIEALLPGLIER